jgi:uncharacterized membrane protein
VITDRQVERSIAILLRAGVLLAASVVLLGGILHLRQRGSDPPHYHTFRGEPVDLMKPSLVIRGALSGRPEAIIQLGLLLLILTPVARVLFSTAAFAFEGDRMYVIMTLMVLAVLLYSLMAA